MDLPRRSLRAPLSSFARVAARSRPARCNATQNGEHLESAAERAAAGCAGVLRGANLTVRGALRSWRLCETAEAVPSSWPPDPASWGGAHQRVRPTLRAGTHRDQSWCSCDAISFAFCPFITHLHLRSATSGADRVTALARVPCTVSLRTDAQTSMSVAEGLCGHAQLTHDRLHWLARRRHDLIRHGQSVNGRSEQQCPALLASSRAHRHRRWWSHRLAYSLPAHR